MEELETSLADYQIPKQQNGVIILDACSPNVPGVFCRDKNDLLEETLYMFVCFCLLALVFLQEKAQPIILWETQHKPHTRALPPTAATKFCSELFLESGTQARARIIDVTKVCDGIGQRHARVDRLLLSSFATNFQRIC